MKHTTTTLENNETTVVTAQAKTIRYFFFVDDVFFELFEFLDRLCQNRDFVHHVIDSDCCVLVHYQSFFLEFLHSRVIEFGTVPVTGILQQLCTQITGYRVRLNSWPRLVVLLVRTSSIVMLMLLTNRSIIAWISWSTNSLVAFLAISSVVCSMRSKSCASNSTNAFWRGTGPAWNGVKSKIIRKWIKNGKNVFLLLLYYTHTQFIYNILYLKKLEQLQYKQPHKPLLF